MAKKFNSNINSANVFEVLSAADGAWTQLRLLNGLTVKELRALAKDLGIKLTSGLRRKFNIEVAIVDKVASSLESATDEPAQEVQETEHADALRSYYKSYKAAELRKILRNSNVKGRSKLTRKADMIEAIIKLDLGKK